MSSFWVPYLEQIGEYAGTKFREGWPHEFEHQECDWCTLMMYDHV